MEQEQKTAQLQCNAQPRKPLIHTNSTQLHLKPDVQYLLTASKVLTLATCNTNCSALHLIHIALDKNF